jgi:hypothetical protein
MYKRYGTYNRYIELPIKTVENITAIPKPIDTIILDLGPL